MNQQLNFRADEDLARALAEAAEDEERSRSSFIRFALRRYLNESDARPINPDVAESGKQPASDTV